MKYFNRIRHSVLTAAASVAAFVPIAFIYAQESKLENPLKRDFNTIPTFIAGALKVMVIVALPVIALFIVVAGFMYIMARGNPGKISEAHKNFVYVLIGALLILGAWVIATLIGGTVTQLVGPT